MTILKIDKKYKAEYLFIGHAEFESGSEIKAKPDPKKKIFGSPSGGGELIRHMLIVFVWCVSSVILGNSKSTKSRTRNRAHNLKKKKKLKHKRKKEKNTERWPTDENDIDDVTFQATLRRKQVRY